MAPVDAVFSLEASKYDFIDVNMMEMKRDQLFERLDFSNMHRKKDLDRIFPIKLSFGSLPFSVFSLGSLFLSVTFHPGGGERF
mmetsp:Transcript_18748/g.34004  ORF Transcript_18748/g.34004 Transcript_18748/m.34004 type:complete len:83 (+) Transcript_18748:71-319(+)